MIFFKIKQIIRRESQENLQKIKNIYKLRKFEEKDLKIKQLIQKI